MCGICGYFSSRLAAEDLQNRLRQMTKVLERRGPDGEDFWFAQNANLGLGHRRLAIIDLSSAASQPMHSHDGRYVITCNGEIYNFIELKRELESQHQITFYSSSDTEVLLESISVWGLRRTLQRARGMWAFALYDRQEKKIHLVRDRFGQKPLFYHYKPDSLSFSSSLDSFNHLYENRLRLNENAMAGYFKYNFVPGQATIFRDIERVAAGSVFTYSLAGNTVSFIGREDYWNAATIWQETPEFSGSIDDAEMQLNQLLKDIVSEQKRSDVELGCFLSGGVDSPILAKTLQQQSNRPVKTFSVGFADQEFDESAAAAEFARQIGSDHHEIKFSDEDVVKLLPECVAAWTEPFADTSQLPMLLLCREARKKVKVCLSGDGADELFAGYVRHRILPRLQGLVDTFPKSSRLVGKTICNFSLGKLRAIGNLSRELGFAESMPRHLAVKLHKLAWALQSKGDVHDSLLAEWQGGKLPLDAPAGFSALPVNNGKTDLKSILLKDIYSYLRDDILVKTDASAMHFGLETRMPYLDNRLFTFAASLPESFLCSAGEQKYLLKRLRSSMFGGLKISSAKSGFSPSLRKLLCGPLRDWSTAAIHDDCLAMAGLEKRVLRQKWQELLTNRYDWSFSIWAMIVFSHWYRRFRGNLSPDL